ncbi:MAG: CopG family transcriptional regulator [Planctomycetes bacterium]|nr:CopG family transcriptional regulator [Planctomycetota bacterium]
MKGVPNRSEFIRAAVLAALDGACPLCKGTGILTPDQRRHWQAFAADHAVKECGECHALHVVCARRSAQRAGAPRHP